MTALAAVRDTDESALLGGDVSSLNFPVAAATTMYAGGMGATDSLGNAVPVTASTALRVWGRIEKTVVNTVAAGFGTAGQLSVELKPGIFCFTNGDAITAADVGKLCYASDDQTVNLAQSAAGVARPVAGYIMGLEGTSVKVAMGPVFGPALGQQPSALGTLAAFASNTITPAATALTNNGVYDVPTTAAASTIVLPAASAIGTRLYFTADGTKNVHTVQYIDATGSVALTTALTASKRHLVMAVKESATIWVANAYVSP